MYRELDNPGVSRPTASEIFDRLSGTLVYWDGKADSSTFPDDTGTAVLCDFHEETGGDGAAFEMFVASGLSDGRSVPGRIGPGPSRVYTCYRIELAFERGVLSGFYRGSDNDKDVWSAPGSLWKRSAAGRSIENLGSSTAEARASRTADGVRLCDLRDQYRRGRRPGAITHQGKTNPPRCRSYARVSGVIATITRVAPTGIDPVTVRFSVRRYAHYALAALSHAMMSLPRARSSTSATSSALMRQECDSARNDAHPAPPRRAGLARFRRAWPPRTIKRGVRPLTKRPLCRCAVYWKDPFYWKNPLTPSANVSHFLS